MKCQTRRARRASIKSQHHPAVPSSLSGARAAAFFELPFHQRGTASSRRPRGAPSTRSPRAACYERRARRASSPHPSPRPIVLKSLSQPCCGRSAVARAGVERRPRTSLKGPAPRARSTLKALMYPRLVLLRSPSLRKHSCAVSLPVWRSLRRCRAASSSDHPCIVTSGTSSTAVLVLIAVRRWRRGRRGRLQQ